MPSIGWGTGGSGGVFKPPQRDREDVIQQRAAFIENMAALDPEKLVVIDETGAQLWSTRYFGWARRGEDVQLVRPLRTRRLNFIGAIGVHAPRACRIVDGTVDGEVFQAFLREDLCPVLQPGDIVIMDRLRVHRVAGVQELIEQAGATMLLLPPYSPDLSPIEMTFSKIKARLGAVGARTLDLLDTVLRTAWASITTAECAAWFRHCGYPTAST